MSDRIVVTLHWRDEEGVKHVEDFVLDPGIVKLWVPWMNVRPNVHGLCIRREEANTKGGKR